jgi:activator of HSP90 ATPase
MSILESENNKSSSIEKESEEEKFVLIQFTDIDDANYCQHFSNKFKTIDIQSDSPVFQIGNRFYSGQYTNNIGTYLFFEQQDSSTTPTSQETTTSAANKKEDTLPISDSTEVTSDLNYNYSGKSFKRLVLSRLFLEEKKD